MLKITKENVDSNINELIKLLKESPTNKIELKADSIDEAKELIGTYVLVSKDKMYEGKIAKTVCPEYDNNFRNYLFRIDSDEISTKPENPEDLKYFTKICSVYEYLFYSINNLVTKMGNILSDKQREEIMELLEEYRDVPEKLSGNIRYINIKDLAKVFRSKMIIDFSELDDLCWYRKVFENNDMEMCRVYDSNTNKLKKLFNTNKLGKEDDKYFFDTDFETLRNVIASYTAHDSIRGSQYTKSMNSF